MIKREKINFDLINLEGIGNIFSNFPDIYSVYLFGPYASGNHTPLSDIDICYLSLKEIDYSVESDFAENVRSHLKTDEVDFYSIF